MSKTKSLRQSLPVSVVLLVHNEAEIIERVIRDFSEKLTNAVPGSELIVAEDGSTDGTKEILARLVQELPELRWEEGKERLGYVRAFKRALQLPKNELVLFCDSSGKHDPDDFWKMLPLMKDHDLVIGYKEDRADPLYRVVMSRVFNFTVNQYFSTSFRDINCPLRLFKKSVFSKVAAQEWREKALVNFEFTLRFVYSGYKVAQVPVKHFKRVNGPSRGLPLNKIPKVVLNLARTFPLLKNDLNQNTNSNRVVQ